MRQGLNTYHFVLISIIILIGSWQHANAQCDVGTPSYTINLTGKPDSVWNSPSVSRGGECCSNNNCIAFKLTLDSLAAGIKIEITSGAIPTGSLFYKISCGGSYSFGQAVCLSGVGPFTITFCKPGGNQNTYKITSIPKPNLKGKLTINEACTGLLTAIGFVEDSTLQWQSVPNNNAYNAYLSCTRGCDSTYVIPASNHPSSVSYRVCGNITGSCSSLNTCDTVFMQFVSNTSVVISPENPTVCFGSATTSIMANGSGGVPPYNYSWSTGESTANINKGAGTFIVSMTDSLNCMVSKDTIIVTAFTSPIKANAGNDSSICNNRNQVHLNGSVQSASGGVWSGGAGNYMDGSTGLIGTYIPTANELNTDSLCLKLITTGNGSCAADTDVFIIHFNPTPTTQFNPLLQACGGGSYTYFTNATGSNRIWTVMGGNIIGLNSDLSVQVKWGQTNPASITIRQSNLFGCDSSITKNIILFDKPPSKLIFHD